MQCVVYPHLGQYVKYKPVIQFDYNIEIDIKIARYYGLNSCAPPKGLVPQPRNRV